ncbi:phage Gp19/Gp15/Gp42 family protein [Erysipelothrix aquatica]|uniref:phage Gp19/Gp15/Gp42 family protein n=1 Tax=Erysipelothrix aquatica TaxID=2683714 RepID=UPI001356BC1F|nr:phage Gp19/Gp15/Gp42 family protein [Erysipelothrix aquatica]
MEPFATVEDVKNLFRDLLNEEITRAEKLLPIVSDSLREEAFKVGKDIDAIMAERASYKNVVKSVTVDIVARVLMTSTEQEPMVQSSESALGYSFSGTFLVPGGGLFIKNSELSRLGLRRQRYGVINLYDTD